MPIVHRIESEHRLTISVHIGEVDDTEFLASYQAIFQDPAFDPAYDHLADLRRTNSTTRSPEAVKEFARLVRDCCAGLDISFRTAVVAPNDLTYRYARLYYSFAIGIPGDFVVFRTLDTALAWLGLEPEFFEEFEKGIPPVNPS